MAANVVPLCDEGGNLAGSMGTLIDIGERKHDEIAFRERQQMLRSAFDDAAVGMALVSPTGDWLRVNAVLCEISVTRPTSFLPERFNRSRTRTIFLAILSIVAVCLTAPSEHI